MTQPQAHQSDAIEPMARVCCYCDPWHVMAPGTYPATHGACPPRLAELLAEIEARPAYVPSTPAGVQLRDLVVCDRCGHPRNVTLAPACFVCRSASSTPVLPTPVDQLDRVSVDADVITAAEVVDLILSDRGVLHDDHPAAQGLREACRVLALWRAGQL